VPNTVETHNCNASFQYHCIVLFTAEFSTVASTIKSYVTVKLMPKMSVTAKLEKLMQNSKNNAKSAKLWKKCL